jgi:hypothetical protein
VRVFFFVSVLERSISFKMFSIQGAVNNTSYWSSVNAGVNKSTRSKPGVFSRVELEVFSHATEVKL